MCLKLSVVEVSFSFFAKLTSAVLIMFILNCPNVYVSVEYLQVEMSCVYVKIVSQLDSCSSPQTQQVYLQM